MTCIEDINKDIKLEKACRICLNETQNMSCNIFDSESDEIIQKIQFCSGVLFKKEAHLSNLICEMCLINLSVAYKFKISCIWSEERSKTHLNTVIEKDYEDSLASNDNIENDYNNIENDDNIENDYNNIENDDNIENDYNNIENDDNIENDYNNIDNDDLSNIVKEIKEEKEIPCNREEDRKSRIISKQLNENKGVVVKSKTSCKKTKYTRSWKERWSYCAKCNIQFKARDLLVAHKKEFHKDTGYMCEVCGKLFSRRAAITTHKLIHRPASLKCEHCSYCTSLKSDLKKHMYTHSDVKHYKCKECPLSFKTASTLKHHVQVQHEKTPKYPCPKCDKGYDSLSRLQSHMDVHESIKRHQCDVCRTLFAKRTYLRKHMLKQHAIILPKPRPGKQKINEAIEKLCK